VLVAVCWAHAHTGRQPGAGEIPKRTAYTNNTTQERQTGGFNAEMDEELEDAAGNVYSRKVYEDLKRQGLL
jgi:hypothetical protein